MDPLPRRKALKLGLSAAAFLVSASKASTADDVVPLALKGYDPVAYFTLGRPVRGLPEFEYEWDEQRYRFATAEHRSLFIADPVRYAPQFESFCAMALANGEIVEANPEYWLVSDSKLYIFGKPDGPALFKKNLARNIAKANQHPLVTLNR